MNINIQSIGFVADVKLEDFIENKLGKIMKLNEDVSGAEVFLRIEKSANTENKVVEISLDAKGGDFFAKKQSKTFEESTDLAVEALRKQVVKHKEKLRAK
nr:ribosome-associated translation inhibitor RaiA [uncultured Marinifilum sp.]